MEIASGKCLLLPGDNIIPNNLTMPPAESDNADGLGEVPKWYPQAPGTRPGTAYQKESGI